MDIKDMLGNFGNIKNKYNLEEEDVYKKFETYEISKLDISRMYRYLDYLCKRTAEPPEVEDVLSTNNLIQD